MTLFRDFWYGIQNLFYWFPVIWRDRDWDDIYLFEMLEHKLNSMEKFFRKDAHYVDCEKDADIMKEVVEALRRLINEDYCSEMYTEVTEKWGELIVKDADAETGFCTLKASNVNTEEEEREYSTMIRDCFNQELQAISDDLALVFNTMRDNVHKWWD